MFFTQVLNGMTVGAIYGLVGLGFALIYSVLGLINFAHGHVYMVGAFIAYTGLSMLGLSFFPSALLAMVFCMLLGLLIEKAAYKPIRKYSTVTQMVSSLAVGIVLQNLAMLVWGSQTYSFRAEVNVNLKIVILALTGVLMIAMTLFLKRTKVGIAIRATSMDMNMASCLGVNSDRTISLVYAIGSLLGGMAGVLVAAYYSTVMYTMGATVGIKSFIGAIIGGLGSMYGPFLGGMLLGISESLAQAYVSPAYKDAIAYIALILILLIRPSGILGKKIEKGG